jgi:hypothetical protein
MTDQAALLDLIQRQHRVVTWRQARDIGMSKDALQRRTKPGGPWQRLLPGVYLTVAGTPTTDQRDTAALLYAGPGGTLTGPAALRRHGMREPRSQVVDVLIPEKRERRNTGFVLLHQTRRLPTRVCYTGPIQYALAARAVEDAAREMQDLTSVRAVVAGAVQTRRCTVEQLEEELRAGPARGSALLRAALDEVGQGVRSVPEGELFHLIKRGRLPTPLFNPLLYDGAEPLARPDAWWPEFGVAVEVDSKQWHLSPESSEETMRRHTRMSALGIIVLHFTPRQIREEPDHVLAEIRRTLDGRRNMPVPAIRAVLAA